MTPSPEQVLPASGPLKLAERSRVWKAGAVVLGTLFLALSSYVEVPMVPVPMTMQTFAVTMVGALYGWRLGGLTIVAWLLEGALGLPVLAGGASGAQHFLGSTGGYLAGFVAMAAIVGWAADRGWDRRGAARASPCARRPADTHTAGPRR